MIRPAEPCDRAAVEVVVRDAYAGYIRRIGKPPAPMLDDYGRLIARGTVSVLEEPPGTIAGLVVLLHQPDHVLLDNVAVRPELQGRGIGRRLIAFAEAEARRRGLTELRLYTHRRMIENVRLYRRLGFVETGRGRTSGYDRIFMRKDLEKFP